MQQVFIGWRMELPVTLPSGMARMLPKPMLNWRALSMARQSILLCKIRISRRKKILIADMDSTMIQQECIDELAEEAGFRDKVAAITARAMNGEIAFEPALRERVALLKGLPYRGHRQGDCQPHHIDAWRTGTGAHDEETWSLYRACFRRVHRFHSAHRRHDRLSMKTALTR